jgi:hypothetical protein
MGRWIHLTFQRYISTQFRRITKLPQTNRTTSPSRNRSNDYRRNIKYQNSINHIPNSKVDSPDRVIPTKEVQSLATLFSCKYIEVSSKTGKKNIRKFQEISRRKYHGIHGSHYFGHKTPPRKSRIFLH